MKGFWWDDLHRNPSYLEKGEYTIWSEIINIAKKAEGVLTMPRLFFVILIVCNMITKKNLKIMPKKAKDDIFASIRG